MLISKCDPQKQGTSQPFYNAGRGKRDQVVYYLALKIELFCSLEGSSKSQ